MKRCYQGTYFETASQRNIGTYVGISDLLKIYLQTTWNMNNIVYMVVLILGIRFPTLAEKTDNLLV